MNIVMPASYIVYIDGSTIKAVNGTTGIVDYSGSDASMVIKNSINALTSGGKLYISEGTYLTTITNPTIFYQKDYITIEGAGQGTILKAGNGVNADVLSAGRRRNVYITMRDFYIDGNKANNSSGRGLVFTGHRSVIENIHIVNCAGNGFDCEVHASENIYDNFVSNIRTRDCGGTGFIWGTQTGGWATDNFFQNIISSTNTGDGIDFKFAAMYGWNINAYNNNGNGIIIRGSDTRITLAESSANGKHGIMLYKNGCWKTIIVACRCINNSTSGTGTYDGLYLNGDDIVQSSRTTLIGCIAYDDQTLKTQRYGVNINSLNVSSTNTIIGGSFSGNLTGSINMAAGTLKPIGVNYPYYGVSILSGTFSIDSTGIKIVTIIHTLDYTPNLQDCYLTIVQDTAVDDWAYNLLKIVSTDAKNVIVKINISTASATVGATAKLALRVGNP